MRYCIYGHFAAVIVSILFGAADRRGMLARPELLPAGGDVFFRIFLIPSLLAWVVCPFLVLLLVCIRKRPWQYVLSAIGVETVLWLAQTAALLPTVQ